MSQIASLEIEPDEELPVAELSGQIDMSNAEALTGAILDAVSNRSLGLIVDLSRVSYMDSAGVNLLADLGRRLSWRGQRFGVVAGRESRPGQVLALAGADRLFPVDATREAAFARVTGRVGHPESGSDGGA